MKKTTSLFKILTFISLIFIFYPIISPKVHGQSVDYVGISAAQMNSIYADQKMSQWCWAASIQMVMNLYGVKISQEDIVYRSYGVNAYGTLPNWTGSYEVISKNLNGWGIDQDGKSYNVSSELVWGSPSSTTIISELSSGYPLILAYSNGSSAHAVVLTGASYTGTKSYPSLTSVIVRDPWPSAENKALNGRREYTGSDFPGFMVAYWRIRVKPISEVVEIPQKIPCTHAVSCTHTTACTHTTSCSHIQACSHPMHYADQAHPYDLNYYGQRFPCSHPIPCSHPRHAADTAHSYDSLHKHDTLHKYDYLHEYD